MHAYVSVCVCACVYVRARILGQENHLGETASAFDLLISFTEYLPRLSQARRILLSCKEASELTSSFSYNILKLQVLDLLLVSPAIYPYNIDLHFPPPQRFSHLKKMKFHLAV